MFHLLKLEWLKIKNNTLFQVLLFLYLIALPTLLLIGKSFKDIPEQYFNNDMFYMFPTVWQYLGYVGNWLTFFICGFIAVISITNEHQYKTMRQNIITGVSRREFFLSKVYFMLALAFFVTLYYAIVGLLFGVTHTDTIYLSKIFQKADLIPRYFLMSFSYMTMGLLIGVLIRRTGIALFLYLAYAFFIERILRYWLQYYALGIDNKSMHFYPMNATSDLVPFDTPLNKMAEGFLQENNFSFFLTPLEATITTLVYVSIFLFLAYRFLQKRDL